MTTAPEQIPPREGETEDTMKFREALNALMGKLMNQLDREVLSKSAPPQVQKMRHVARNDLLNFGLKAMHARDLSKQNGGCNG